MVREPWKVKKEDLVQHQFASIEDAVQFAIANTTEEHMCVLITPGGQEFTMLRRPKGHSV